MELAAKRLRISTTPKTSISSYLMTIKVNLIKSARNADLTQEGENHLNHNLKFGG